MSTNTAIHKRFSKHWKVETLVFPSIGKSRADFSNPWKTRGFFPQALETRKSQAL